MTRYARRPEHRGQMGWLSGGISNAGAVIARNPVGAGATTAFLVSLTFVSANALFYQPQMHPSAFVSTRTPAAFATPDVVPAPERVPQPSAAPREEIETILEEQAVRNTPSHEATGSIPEVVDDVTIRDVQTVLNDLGLYDGAIDGMVGPQTHTAIESYRRIVGLEPGTGIDAALLRQLGLKEQIEPVAEMVPQPAPRASEPADDVQVASSADADPLVRHIQAGLKAFGNDGVEIDGVMGEETRKAIRDFQSLFGLPVTGEPDEELRAKMLEIGLIN